MKALSLWKPWASLIVIGAKRFATRHWETSYRGPLLIHAAKRSRRDSGTAGKRLFIT
jgi:activating signal cointegrator 1